MDCISSIENSLLIEILKATGQTLIGTLVVLGVLHLRGIEGTATSTLPSLGSFEVRISSIFHSILELLRLYCCMYMLMSTVKFSMESWNMTGRILSGDQVSVMVLPGENSKLEVMKSTLCPLSGESVYLRHGQQ